MRNLRGYGKRDKKNKRRKGGCEIRERAFEISPCLLSDKRMDLDKLALYQWSKM